MNGEITLSEAERDMLWDSINRAYVDTTTWDAEVEAEVERTVVRIILARMSGAS